MPVTHPHPIPATPMAVSHDMSPWTLVAEASVLVQLVMLILVLASLVSWCLIVRRGILLSRTQRALDSFEQRFNAQRADPGALIKKDEEISASGGIENIFQSGYREFMHLGDHREAEPEAVLEGAQRAMRVAICREEERLGKHLPFLATVGSVSPYIGLFGTVWGIMNSFIGLAQVQQATLAAVAPGIAEALIATAIGLFAAIPAVIAYNRFSAANEHLIHRYYTFAEEFSVFLHRRLHGRAAR